MTNIFANRKRLRENEDEDKPDCIPLSKRINNLHIDAGTSYNGLSMMPLCKHSCSSQVDSYSPMKQEATAYNDCVSLSISNCNGSSRSNESAAPQFSYNPDLSASDNPHYYEPNRLLYNLYIERVQRSNGAAMHVPY
ncbi:unnamed protein product [Bemisia tabaci]|uniref:Uncharacterized protein n=1 Tax=Bemisia tabaci TaxID=7038 RepID=A0A9P0F1W9_BEMTA|nr:PREDICTED: uncharacterized protein LOC109035421 [Bemisia tabaci]CAH0388408.1 unnamed protein product [Bemisia tabaci]